MLQESEIITTKEMLKGFKMAENQSEDVSVIILKVDNDKFKTQTKCCDTILFGKTMTEWVSNAVFDAKVIYEDYNFGDDFLPIAKQVCDLNYKYTCVFFSDTPLLQRKTYLQIMEYVKVKKLSALKLTRGYVFETEYLMNIGALNDIQTQYFEEEDFITCHSLKQTAMVRDILKNRILSYFMKNGVDILDTTSVFVDADSQIHANSIIEPFVCIKGKSVVEQNVKLGANTMIVDSVVCQNSTLEACTIRNSLVGRNCKIGHGAIVTNNTKIEDGVTVPPYCILDGVIVDQNTKLKSFVKYEGREE